MSYCSNCIHYKVCGNEGVDDSAMTFCADKQISGDLVNRQAVLDIISDVMPIYSDNYHYILEEKINELPTIPQVVCDDDCEHCSWVECPLVYKESEEEECP